MRTIAGVTAAVLLVAGWRGTSAQTETLAVALVSGSGILVPAAVFDGAAWTGAWPEPSEIEALIPMLRGVPPTYWGRNGLRRPDRWYLARPNTAQHQHVNARTMVIYQEHCGMQVGLLTDMRPQRTDTNERLLVTDRAVPVVWPAAEEPDDRLAKLIRQQVTKQEERAILDWESHLRQRAELEPLAERKPITFHAIYARHGAHGRTTYYEAHRSYGRPVRSAPNPLRAILMVTGWIHEPLNGAPATLDTRAVIIDPRHKESGTMRPLGIISLGSADYWFGQVMGYESEALTIVRVDAASVRKAHDVVIGGC